MQQLEETKQHLSEFLRTAYHQIITISPRLITGVIVFLLFWIAAFIISYIVRRTSDHSKSRRYLMRLLSQIAYATMVIIGAITALGTMGVDILALVTGLGLAGFALGFALKDALSNTLAGFMVLCYKPFKINDAVSIDNAEGVVSDINLRYTEIQAEGKTFLVPNSIVLTKTVTVVKPD